MSAATNDAGSSPVGETGCDMVLNAIVGSAGLVPSVATLTEGIDLLLVMPATANIIGKSAHGIYDDLVSTTICASDAPVVFVPMMHARMSSNRVVQRNMSLLRELGYHIIGPGGGQQLSDLEGSPEGPSADDLIEELTQIVRQHRRAGNEPQAVASRFEVAE